MHDLVVVVVDDDDDDGDDGNDDDGNDDDDADDPRRRFRFLNEARVAKAVAAPTPAALGKARHTATSDQRGYCTALHHRSTNDNVDDKV